ncbi:MAG: acyl-ACP--UDP-N-acetylglucosamine O-acyltransferase [Bacteriovoracia bacterium]
MKVHPTAVVHPEAKVDPSCEIGPYCIIGAQVSMGPNNKLLSHVVIDNKVTIGEGNTFHSFSVIGDTPQDLKYKGENTEVVIGNQNTIRECVTINLGTEGGGKITSVGNNCLLMAYVHLGHDCKIGSNVIIGNSCQIAGHVTIEDYAILGGLCGVSQFIRVGAHCYVGGCSGVDRDMPPFSMGRGPSPGFQIWGMNLVGLKRRAFTDESISTLQQINKIFFKDKSLEKEAALRKIEQEYGEVEVARQFITFIRASDKGVFR